MRAVWAHDLSRVVSTSPLNPPLQPYSTAFTPPQLTFLLNTPPPSLPSPLKVRAVWAHDLTRVAKQRVSDFIATRVKLALVAREVTFPCQ